LQSRHSLVQRILKCIRVHALVLVLHKCRICSASSGCQDRNGRSYVIPT
jgi:hypothetical protein